MVCLSTNLREQRREEFNVLLRLFVALSWVFAVVGEATSIRFPVLDGVFVAGPFVLYYWSYYDRLGTERLHRSFKWQPKMQTMVKKRAKDDARTESEAARKTRAATKDVADAEAADKRVAAEKARIEDEAECQPQQHEPSAEPEVVSNKDARSKKWNESRENRKAQEAAKAKARNEAMAAAKTAKKQARAKIVAAEDLTQQNQVKDNISEHRFGQRFAALSFFHHRLAPWHSLRAISVESLAYLHGHFALMRCFAIVYLIICLAHVSTPSTEGLWCCFSGPAVGSLLVLCHSLRRPADGSLLVVPLR
jgi:hypothetical protein